eukprot:scaffold57524_cov55-Phaeocystis_antarctica.AAC.2
MLRGSLLHERQVRHGHGLPQGIDDDHVGLVLDALDDIVDADGEVLCEEAAQHLLLLGPLAAVEPLVRVRRVAEVEDLEEHRGRGEVEPDPLAVGQREQPVVVHDAVHVLDPHGVDVAVVDDVPPLVAPLGHRPVHIAEDIGEQPVGPVARRGVEQAVELVDGHGLGVDEEDLGGQPEAGLRLGERGERDGFAAAGRADDHGGVPREQRLVELDDLVDLHLEHLQPVVGDGRLDGVVERGVAHARAVEPGEEVADEPAKERHVGEDEFWHVHVAQRAHEDGALAARHNQHALERAQPEVVVVLLGELLLGELIEHSHLLGEQPRLGEALGHEHVLADHAEIGRHHDHRPEERLEVVGQLGAAGVARVHSDVDADAVDHGDLAPLKGEALEPLGERRLDGLDLCRHHREHLDRNAVELVEAAPRARLHEAREDVAHRLEVEALTTAEDLALQRHGLGQVLDRLRLARARGAGGRAAEAVVQRLRARHEAAVGEWRDDEARREALVLVAKLEEPRALPDEHVVGLAVPAKAQLALPRKLALV